MSVSVGNRDLPLGVSAAAGAVALVLAYLGTYPVASSEIKNSLLDRVL
jgi:hypothetical protein